MNTNNLEEMSVDQLVTYFMQVTVAQDDAITINATAKYTRLFKEMMAIVNELKRRSGDQRRALLPLYKHPSLQVRLMAARLTLAIAPEEARLELEAISDMKWCPQGLDAGMALWSLERGIFKPT